MKVIQLLTFDSEVLISTLINTITLKHCTAFKSLHTLHYKILIVVNKLQEQSVFLFKNKHFI